MTVEQEITKAVEALRDRHIKAIRKIALVQPRDRAKEKFMRAVMLHPWGGKGEAAMAIAYVIAELMDWDEGTLGYCNSSGDLSIISGRPVSTARDGVAALIREGFLVAPARGPRQRGALMVAAYLKDRQPGQCNPEHLSQRLLNVVNHLIGSGRGGVQIGDDLGGVAPSLGGMAPTYPSCSSPVNKTSDKQAGSGQALVGLEAGTTSKLQPTLPAATYTSELGSPVDATIVDATKGKEVAATNRGRAPVVDATKDSAPVASATSTWGYGNEIEGLNGKTHELADRMAKLAGGINLNPDAGWESVKQAMTRATLKHGSVEAAAIATVAAVEQMEAKAANDDLTTPRPLKALAGWAESVDPSKVIDKAGKAVADKKRYETLRRQSMFNPNLDDEDRKFMWAYEKRREEWERANPEAAEAEKAARRAARQQEDAERAERHRQQAAEREQQKLAEKAAAAAAEERYRQEHYEKHGCYPM